MEEDYTIIKQSIENKLTKWHEEIDKIVNMLQNKTDEMRDIQMKALNKHLQKVKEFQAGVQEVIKSNKDRISPTLQKHFHTRLEIQN